MLQPYKTAPIAQLDVSPTASSTSTRSDTPPDVATAYSSLQHKQALTTSAVSTIKSTSYMSNSSNINHTAYNTTCSRRKCLISIWSTW